MHWRTSTRRTREIKLICNSPRLASSLAVSFPIPVFAPVTTAVLPASETVSIATGTTGQLALSLQTILQQSRFTSQRAAVMCWKQSWHYYFAHFIAAAAACNAKYVTWLLVGAADSITWQDCVATTSGPPAILYYLCSYDLDNDQWPWYLTLTWKFRSRTCTVHTENEVSKSRHSKVRPRI